MGSPAASKRRGARFELDALDWLREHGYSAERLRLAGRMDEGDLVVAGDVPTVLECKAPGRDGRLNLTDWMRQAEVEASHYAAARRLTVVRPLLVVKAPSKPISQAFAIQRLIDVL